MTLKTLTLEYIISVKCSLRAKAYEYHVNYCRFDFTLNIVYQTNSNWEIFIEVFKSIYIMTISDLLVINFILYFVICFVRNGQNKFSSIYKTTTITNIRTDIFWLKGV